MDASSVLANVLGALLTLIFSLFTLLFSLLPLIFLAFIGFWIWMIVDCVKYESSQGNDKVVWLLILLFTNGIGAVIYFFVRRSQRLKNPPIVPPKLPQTR